MFEIDSLVRFVAAGLAPNLAPRPDPLYITARGRRLHRALGRAR